MNKKIKMFASLLMIAISSFVVYVVINKQILSKADRQTTNVASNIDANGYRGGAVS